MSIDLILYILAFLFFVMAGANTPKFGWQWFAAACLVASLII